MTQLARYNTPLTLLSSELEGEHHVTFKFLHPSGLEMAARMGLECTRHGDAYTLDRAECSADSGEGLLLGFWDNLTGERCSLTVQTPDRRDIVSRLRLYHFGYAVFTRRPVDLGGETSVKAVQEFGAILDHASTAIANLGLTPELVNGYAY